ncbi:ABC transporter permease [Thiolapillus brandeum]|uniref:Transport permease protein n=1 Tax=Thiolapillus brandeum TaxID=1076588 RepID=A0A7U6GIK0_9GAMM|nr:ABC transporter permease [Thiolapillus brandeum]BAO44263.1 lipopolysaccharide transporter permease [Thiolapillus brandeum]
MNQHIQDGPPDSSGIGRLKINGSRFFELVLFRAYAELTAEAARFSLGVLWWLIEPILYVGVFYLIFGIIFQRGGEGFVFSLLTGLLTWRWFDASVRGGATSIQGNAALIRQIAIPKLTFPIVVLLVNLAKFCIVFSIFLVFLTLVHGAPTSRWLVLPLLLSVQLLFTAGVSFMIAAWVPFFPDLIMINNQFLTLWFFLSGIFFDISNVDAKFRALLLLNPMAVIIDSYRAVLLHDVWPDWLAIGKVAVISIMIILASLIFYRRFDHTYPKLVF